MKNRMFVGLVAAATALVLSSSLASADEQAAYSANAIGVIKKTIPAGKQSLMSVPLDQTSDSGDGFIFASVPAISNMPDGSVANFWDVTNQIWITQTKTARYGWSSQKNRKIAVGEPFFIKNVQSSNMEVVISGEVPESPALSKGLANNAMVLVANPYPVPTVLTNFAFADSLADGSVVNFWDEANQIWITQTKTARYGWSTQKNRLIQPGEGFFVKSAGAEFEWTESRPYTWPN